MKQLAWSELSYPFPSRINIHSDAVHRETVEWACEFGLIPDNDAYRKVLATNIGRLAGRFHPTAPRDRLRLVSDWYSWMFFRDDLCDEAAIGMRPDLLAETDLGYLEILRGARPDGENPLAVSMVDLRRRLLPTIPAALWMRRFTRSVREHFESSLWEAFNRSRGTIPELETYRRMRPVTGGMYVDADFIEITTDIYLPPEIHGNRTVAALTKMSNNAVCWANDLVSLEKELAIGDVHNIVIVLKQHLGLSDIEEATAAAVELHAKEVESFLDLQEDVPSFGASIDENLARYISVLRSRMRGNLDWSLESSRYGHVRSL